MAGERSAYTKLRQTMKRKIRVNTKAIPDAQKPRDLATLADFPELALDESSDREGAAADISAEDIGGIESLAVGPTTVAGEQLRTTSVKGLKRLASSMSNYPEYRTHESVSPVKRHTAPDLITPKLFKDHAQTINNLVAEAIRKHLEISKACLKAKEEVGNKRYRDFVSMLNMSSSEFSKYCAIGKKELLHGDDMRDHLPSSFSSLYLISTMSDGQLQKAIDDGKIRPQSTRVQIEELLPSKEQSKSKEIRSIPGPWFAVVELAADCDEAERKKIHRALAQLKDKNPAVVRVLDRVDLEEAEKKREKERYDRGLRRQLCILVRKRVRHAGKTYLKKIHKKEALQFPDDADDTRLKEILTHIHCESEYEDLLKQAKREVDAMSEVTGDRTDTES
jgi:hypothetical protein